MAQFPSEEIYLYFLAELIRIALETNLRYQAGLSVMSLIPGCCLIGDTRYNLGRPGIQRAAGWAGTQARLKTLRFRRSIIK